jgi:periodic tryptophan protein 2
MDGVFDFISRRKKAEFGFNLSLIKSREEKADMASIALPGVRRGDFSDRSANPLIATTALQFSPTMRSFVAATTEGILVYSLDVGNTFDPYLLEEGVTEDSVRAALRAQEFGEALMQALKLNEARLVAEAIEGVPKKEIPFVSSSLPLIYVEKTLHHLAVAVESTRHLEYYLIWSQTLLQQHGALLKSNHSSSGSSLMSTLRLLQRNLGQHFQDLGKICDFNKYTLQFCATVGQKMLDKKRSSDDEEPMDGVGEEGEGEEEGREEDIEG